MLIVNNQQKHVRLWRLYERKIHDRTGAKYGKLQVRKWRRALVSYKYRQASNRKGRQMNAFENMVYETALESVGSFENSILDGMSEKGTMTRDKMMQYARWDVMDECPREVRFLGAKRITELCYKAVDSFEFRTW